MSRVDLALGLLVMLLAAVVGMQWSQNGGPDGAGAPRPPPVAPPQAAPAPPVPERPLPGPAGQYDVVVERPLFVESRRPPPPAPVAAAEPDTAAAAEAKPSTPPPKLVLEGLVLKPGGEYALVRDARGERRRLAVGDELGGWRVAELAPTALVLASGEHREAYPLRAYRNGSAAADDAAGRRGKRRFAGKGGR